MKKYAGYDFNTEFGKNSWFDFLQMYFEETQRESRDKEDGLPAQRARQAAAVTNAIFNSSGMLADGEAVEDKPTGATGVGCGCPSIKNYPTKNKLTPGKTKRTVRAPLMTEGVFQSAFKKKL